MFEKSPFVAESARDEKSGLTAQSPLKRTKDPEQQSQSLKLNSTAIRLLVP